MSLSLQSKRRAILGFLELLGVCHILVFLVLLAVLLCAGADAVILYKPDGKEVDTWKFSPSVLLAILSEKANVCLEFARSEGVIIAWWRKALRGGTLYGLSRYWESGDSLLKAATSGRGFNLVVLANVVASTIVLNSSLLQRASTVTTVPLTRTANVTSPIAQELPYGYTGFRTFFGVSPPQLVMNKTFGQVFNSYITRDPITAPFTGCGGKCSGP